MADNSLTNHNEKTIEIEGKALLMRFDRKQREIVYELKIKRALLTQCQEELNEAVEVKEELHRQLKTLNRTGDQKATDYQNSKEKLEILQKEIWQYSDTCKQHEIYLKLKEEENALLKEHYSQLKQENLDQSREIEELKSQVRFLSGIKNDHLKLSILANSAIPRIEDLVNKVENEQKEMDAYIGEREEIIFKLSEAVQQTHIKYQNVKRELEAVQKKLLNLTTAPRSAENLNQKQVIISVFVMNEVKQDLTFIEELREELQNVRETNASFKLVVDDLKKQLIIEHKENISIQQEVANLTQELLKESKETMIEIIKSENQSNNSMESSKTTKNAE